MEYIRASNCDCKDYVDISTLPYKERNLEKFWMKGFMYDGNSSKECECHKRYRLSTRFDCIANAMQLPTSEELDNLSYKGESSCFEKLMTAPEMIESKNLKNVIIYVQGPYGNQKTTSVLKLMLHLIRKGKTVQYVDFTSLSKSLLDLEFNTTELKNADYLIIDDCFEGEVINFQNTFNAVFDIILKRRNPTILVSSKPLEEINFKHYDMSLLNNIQSRIKRHNTILKFTDNIDNLLLKENGPVDLWS